MQLPIYQIDAFSDQVFGGNPAAICPLDDWLPDAAMQAIAAENNLPETAFFVRQGDDYALRWFTSLTEVDLCGHATLASAFVILNRLEPGRERVTFHTVSAGTLSVGRQGDMLAMDFPVRPPVAVAPPPTLARLFDKVPAEVLAARDLFLVYQKEADVAALNPNLPEIAKLDLFAVIVTAPGSGDIDFVSRFFSPQNGIPEDSATGSAHCTLVPYWAARLGKTRLQARQISKRGGKLTCTLNGDRVILAGRAVLYMEGTITI